MTQITSSGAVLFRKIDGRLHFLTVESQANRGYWGLVKGRIEDGERITEAAYRDLLEEVGTRFPRSPGPEFQQLSATGWKTLASRDTGL